ncbi:MAG TPA: hypothetical protein VL970_11165 [Candidatus Acidoferrales bacterium]|nr:hypothetical protein [Candidatus Acidoferrales bacterium]
MVGNEPENWVEINLKTEIRSILGNDLGEKSRFAHPPKPASKQQQKTCVGDDLLNAARSERAHQPEQRQHCVVAGREKHNVVDGEESPSANQVQHQNHEQDEVGVERI